MPNTTEVNEAEIAKLVSDGGLKQETLARRRRVRASFQGFTVQHYEKDVTELINEKYEKYNYFGFYLTSWLQKGCRSTAGPCRLTNP